MNVLLALTTAGKTSSVLTDLEAMFVNVLVGMNYQMELVKVKSSYLLIASTYELLDLAYCNSLYFHCKINFACKVSYLKIFNNIL